MQAFLRPNLTVITTSIFLAIAPAVKALEVKVSPTTPQQGDTISVIITTDVPNSKPTVTVESKSYPVFQQDNHYRAFIPTSPLTAAGKMALTVEGDKHTSNIGLWVKSRSFPTQYITLTGSASRPATQMELDKVAAFKKLVTPEKYWQGAFIRPSAARVSTEFGLRRYYNGEFAQDYYHRGVDYAGETGSAVVAPAAGKVRLIGKESEGFHVHGNVVGIDHGQGVVSIFMHLKDINVTEGTMVKPGQQIGTVGATGASTGPHLHWGLYVNEVAVDPVPWRYNVIE